MGLSDYDKKVLEQLERDLSQGDDAFYRKLNPTKIKTTNSAAKLIAGALVALVGMSLLVFGAITQLVVFGVFGFVVALVGILVASANPVGRTEAKNPPRKAKPSGTFFEKRWENRRDQS